MIQDINQYAQLRMAYSVAAKKLAELDKEFNHCMTFEEKQQLKKRIAMALEERDRARFELAKAVWGQMDE